MIASSIDYLESPERADSQARTAEPSAANVRVLHVINGEHYAGAERVQDLLAARLPEQGYDVGFACMKSGQFATARKMQSAPLYSVPMRSRADLRPVSALVRLIRQEGYTLLHSHSPRAALIARASAAIAGVPLVHHLHSPTGRDTTHRVRDWLNSATEKASLRGAAAIIAVSRSVGCYARGRGYSADKVFVVPNGVPTHGPLPARTAPKEPWTLGTVALFRPRKGLEVLLDALAALRLQGHAVRLRAVGGFETPEYEAAIGAQVSRLNLGDAIDWRGFQRDVNAELAAMDLFVLPSLFGEGLPMVVLEAMAAGVPVVGTRVEGVPEAIRDCEDGVIVNPNDALDLALGIRRFLRGDVDWSELRASAHERQAENFSDRSMAAGVAQVYQSVLARRQ